MNDNETTHSEPVSKESMELIATLMEHSMAQTQHTTEWVMEAMRRENAELHGTIAAIRQHVDDLLSNPYMPHREDILNAVFNPNPALIARHAGPVLAKHWSRGEGTGN